MTPDEFGALRAMVKADEGLRLLPYTDTRGKLTIGYGRNLTDVGISSAEASAMLDADLEAVVARLTLAHPDVMTLDPVRQIVLASMAFNLGVTGIGAFHELWAAIDRQDWAAAAREIMDSAAARELPARYQRFADAMRTAVL